MNLLKHFSQSRTMHRTIGTLAAEYLRLVWRTSRCVIEPADFYERIAPDLPIIAAMWHGQHLMAPFLRREQDKVKVLISRHRDGEINAAAVERLGSGTIRGSGNHGARYDRKGGVAALKGMIDALSEGYSIAMTADVPKVARVAGAGIVTLARFSGRAIYPVAAATSRRIELNSWDRTAVNLPFGRLVIVAGDPIRVAADADEGAQEAARQAVEAGLNAATARAYDLVDHRKH
jgi:lysophospholipid acyltransferase (LPLAT)-like uncharacterized protein